MAKNTSVTTTPEAWTELTDGDVSAITFQVLGSHGVRVAATVGNGSEPASTADVVYYFQGQGERNVSLADLFPGITGANRVWAWSNAETTVFVSHA